MCNQMKGGGVGQNKMKSLVKDDLVACRADCKSLESLIGGRKAPSKSNDAAIVTDGVISDEYVTKILEEFSWPDCYSRANVRPEGSLFISAFPMGAVLNYCQCLMCSRTLSVWPNLGKLVNRWAFQKLKDFPYTTIQFNKNYTAKMHVDGNNHGWSYIIGLGDYSGGELWLYDPKAHAEMEVKDTMRGFPELKVGMMARGKVVSIKNTWIKFDGNCPHAVYPFEGKRISIVLFTRQRWLNMRAEHKEKLMGFGFPIPGDEYMLVCTDREKRILLNSPSLSATPSAKRVKMEESDDEVDEEEQLDAALRQDEEGNTTLWRARAWAAQFQQFLGVAWGNKSVGSDPIRIVTSCVGLKCCVPVSICLHICYEYTQPKNGLDKHKYTSSETEHRLANIPRSICTYP